MKPKWTFQDIDKGWRQLEKETDVPRFASAEESCEWLRSGLSSIPIPFVLYCMVWAELGPWPEEWIDHFTSEVAIHRKWRKE